MASADQSDTNMQKNNLKLDGCYYVILHSSTIWQMMGEL